MWTWDEEHESAHVTVPFASAREADWAAKAIGGSRADLVEVETTGQVRLFRVWVSLASPDSYSPEWEERERDPERYRARMRAALSEATARIEAELERLGLAAAEETPKTPEVEARIAATRRAHLRAMPPTRRREREAVTVLAEDDDGYLLEGGRRAMVFCDYRTGERVDPVGLLVGETYWMHGSEIDVRWSTTCRCSPVR